MLKKILSKIRSSAAQAEPPAPPPAPTLRQVIKIVGAKRRWLEDADLGRLDLRRAQIVDCSSTKISEVTPGSQPLLALERIYQEGAAFGTEVLRILQSRGAPASTAEVVFILVHEPHLGRRKLMATVL